VILTNFENNIFFVYIVCALDGTEKSLLPNRTFLCNSQSRAWWWPENGPKKCRSV